MRKRFVSIALLALLITIGGCNSNNSANNPAIDEGVAAATKWLELLDSGKYDEAFSSAPEIGKIFGTKRRFWRNMKDFRGTLGKKTSRVVKDTGYAKDPKNAPPGEYVQIHFTTLFTEAKSVTELVDVKKQPDGVWQVVQYSVKPD